MAMNMVNHHKLCQASFQPKLMVNNGYYYSKWLILNCWESPCILLWWQLPADAFRGWCQLLRMKFVWAECTTCWYALGIRHDCVFYFALSRLEEGLQSIKFVQFVVVRCCWCVAKRTCSRQHPDHISGPKRRSPGLVCMKNYISCNIGTWYFQYTTRPFTAIYWLKVAYIHCSIVQVWTACTSLVISTITN